MIVGLERARRRVGDVADDDRVTPGLPRRA
jgi:hypothetical protein